MLVGPAAVERRRQHARERKRPLGRGGAAQRRQQDENVHELCKPAARLNAEARIGSLGRRQPLDSVGGEVIGRYEPAALLHELE